MKKNSLLIILCLFTLSACAPALKKWDVEAIENNQKAIAIISGKNLGALGSDDFIDLNFSPYGLEIEGTGPREAIYKFTNYYARSRGFQVFLISKPGKYSIKELITEDSYQIGNIIHTEKRTYDIDDRMSFDIQLGEVKYLGRLEVGRMSDFSPYLIGSDKKSGLNQESEHKDATFFQLVNDYKKILPEIEKAFAQSPDTVSKIKKQKLKIDLRK